MATFRDPFTGREFNFDENSGYQEFHFSSDGNMGSGRRSRRGMSDEEYQEYMKSRMKSHLYQGYKGCPPGRWLETNPDELISDIPEAGKPKYWNVPYYYVQVDRGTRDYLIKSEFALLVFYDHAANTFIYLRSDGQLLPEKNLFDSEEAAFAGIKNKIETAPLIVQIVKEDENDEEVKKRKLKEARIKAWKLLHGLE